MLDPFFNDLLAELATLDRRHSAWPSLAYVREYIHVELAGLRREMCRPESQRSWLRVRKHLVAIAAICRRGCRDLEIETKADAAQKDIPF